MTNTYLYIIFKIPHSHLLIISTYKVTKGSCGGDGQIYWKTQGMEELSHESKLPIIETNNRSLRNKVKPWRHRCATTYISFTAYKSHLWLY